MRVVVTGSRDWPWPFIVQEALFGKFRDAYRTTHGREFSWGPNSSSLSDYDVPLTIMRGDASGADESAGDFASAWGIPCEEYPADWKKHGKAAGPIRNGEMVKAAVKDGTEDVTFLAFRLNGSRGTSDCINKLLSAGVEGMVYDLTITEVG